jgi:hypothetical protein
MCGRGENRNEKKSPNQRDTGMEYRYMIFITNIHIIYLRIYLINCANTTRENYSRPCKGVGTRGLLYVYHAKIPSSTSDSNNEAFRFLHSFISPPIIIVRIASMSAMPCCSLAPSAYVAYWYVPVGPSNVYSSED